MLMDKAGQGFGRGQVGRAFSAPQCLALPPRKFEGCGDLMASGWNNLMSCSFTYGT